MKIYIVVKQFEVEAENAEEAVSKVVQSGTLVSLGVREKPEPPKPSAQNPGQ